MENIYLNKSIYKYRNVVFEMYLRDTTNIFPNSIHGQFKSNPWFM